MKRKWNIAAEVLAAIAIGILFVGVARAWVDPTSNPPGGAGGIKAGTALNRNNLGIGLLSSEEPGSTTTVKGTVAVGRTFSFLSQGANPNGAIVEGFLGIGTTTPSSRLSIEGGVTLGATALTFTAAQRMPRDNVNVLLDAALATHISLTIGADGLPVVAYAADGAVKIAKCQVIDCRTWLTTSLGTSAQGNTSIAIGTDGYPVVAHINNGNITVYKCGNIDCTSGSSKELSASALFSTSIAIAPPNGFPIIAYRTTGSRLGFISCGSQDCTTATVYPPVDNTVNTGRNVSLAVGGDGLPVMSYLRANPDTLRVAHCNDLTCTNPTITDVETNGITDNVGQYSSLTFGRSGNPIISYYGGDATGKLRIAACKNAACTNFSLNTINAGGSDDATTDGTFTSIAIGRFSLPIVAHLNKTSNEVRFTKCGLEDCSGLVNWTRDVAPTFSTQQNMSLAVGSDGLPVIAYRTASGGLGILRCASEICIPFWVRR